MGIIRGAKRWTARAVLATVFLASVDGMSTEGKYGGAMLDKMGFNQAANNYRFVGKLGRGAFLWVQGSASSYMKDIDRLGNKYGQPKP